MGHVVEVIGPDRFRTLPCPTYGEIRLAVLPLRKLARLIEEFEPDYLHIATEGPLGMAAHSWARRRGARFTTSFHTRFAEYINARTGIPPGVIYPVLRRFHDAAEATFVATASLRDELCERGFRNIRAWTRGVDLEQFTPQVGDPWKSLPRPVFLYAGRVAVEKNIGAFLSLDLPGSKVVVGEGPLLDNMRRTWPEVTFTGARFGTELAASYAGADVFVFPSKTDTFGLVLLEALACGTPVAAFDVTGPRDVLAGAAQPIGVVGHDLRKAALAALEADRAACRAHAERFSWRACAEMMLENLVPLY